jgi:hypothetical protein
MKKHGRIAPVKGRSQGFRVLLLNYYAAMVRCHPRKEMDTHFGLGFSAGHVRKWGKERSRLKVISLFLAESLDNATHQKQRG